MVSKHRLNEVADMSVDSRIAAMEYVPTARDIEELAAWLTELANTNLPMPADLIARAPAWYKPYAAWNQVRMMDAEGYVAPWDMSPERVEYMFGLWASFARTTPKKAKEEPHMHPGAPIHFSSGPQRYGRGD